MIDLELATLEDILVELQKRVYHGSTYRFIIYAEGMGTLISGHNMRAEVLQLIDRLKRLLPECNDNRFVYCPEIRRPE